MNEQQAFEIGVLEEKSILDDNRGKLFRFMITEKFTQLTPEAQRLMIQQELVMRVYSEILGRRIDEFKR